MLKTILISSLAAILVVAIGFSAYNVLASSQSQTTQQQASVAQGAGYGAGGEQNAAGQHPAVQANSTTQIDSAATASDFAGPAANTALANPQGTSGQGGGYRRGQSGAQGNQQNGTGEPQAQNNLTSLVTYSGVVSSYAAPQFTLITADGQAVLVQLGNQNYSTSQGLVLQDGDTVTVTGFIDSSGALAVTSITLASTGQTFTLRDGTSGRPTWAGGRNQ